MSQKKTGPKQKRKVPRTAYKKGRSGNPRGRPKGSKNKASVEAKALCMNLIHDPDYQEKLGQRMRRGKIAPAIEQMVWHYGAGKPKETVDLNVSPQLLETLPTDELERIKALATQAQQILGKLGGA